MHVIRAPIPRPAWVPSRFQYAFMVDQPAAQPTLEAWEQTRCESTLLPGLVRTNPGINSEVCP